MEAVVLIAVLLSTYGLDGETLFRKLVKFILTFITQRNIYSSRWEPKLHVHDNLYIHV